MLPGKFSESRPTVLGFLHQPLEVLLREVRVTHRGCQHRMAQGFLDQGDGLAYGDPVGGPPVTKVMHPEPLGELCPLNRL